MEPSTTRCWNHFLTWKCFSCILFAFFLFYNCIQSSIGFFSLIPCQWFIWLEIRHERECAGMNLLLRHTPSFSTNGQRDVILKSAHRCARKYIRDSIAAAITQSPASLSFQSQKVSADFCSSCAAVVPEILWLFLILFHCWPQTFFSYSWTFSKGQKGVPFFSSPFFWSGYIRGQTKR
jgi:hypothetical protein